VYIGCEAVNENMWHNFDTCEVGFWMVFEQEAVIENSGFLFLSTSLK
jgi:hypothetical protein